MDIEKVFEKFDDEYGKFDRVESKLSQRADIHAYLLLDSLVPGTEKMVSGADDGDIFLSVDAADLAGVATEDQVRDLVRCGVRCSVTFGSAELWMYT